jgi:hypothetical protein
MMTLVKKFSASTHKPVIVCPLRSFPFPVLGHIYAQAFVFLVHRLGYVVRAVNPHVICQVRVRVRRARVPFRSRRDGHPNAESR